MILTESKAWTHPDVRFRVDNGTITPESFDTFDAAAGYAAIRSNHLARECCVDVLCTSAAGAHWYGGPMARRRYRKGTVLTRIGIRARDLEPVE